MSYAEVVDVEAEWFALDLDGVPPLLRSAGGPFDIVAAHVRRLGQARHQLYLAHGPTTEPRGSKSTRRLDHEVVAIVLWAATGAGAREHEDQDSIDDAVAAVVERIHGPEDDVDHGGRWFKIGRVPVEPASPLDRIRFADAITAAGAAHTVVVRYSVTELVDR